MSRNQWTMSFFTAIVLAATGVVANTLWFTP